MDACVFVDPNLVIKVGKELQQRIGIMPVVEVHPFHLESQPGRILRMLRVQPRSYSEIARVVRAARTMKLTVRACGQCTGGDSDIYGAPITVLVDCGRLADTPSLEFVNVTRKGEDKSTPGLRILACVRIEELVDFQIANRIEIAQSVETTSVWGTVVGAITSTRPGIVGPAGLARGACLSDEVLSVRIVDCNGDLIQYSADEELSCALSTLGLLGIVYDVTVRYRPLSLTKVNYQFNTWSELLDRNNDIIRSSLLQNQFTEIIYLPYNSRESNPADESTIENWNPADDEVLIRTGQQHGLATEVGDTDSSKRQKIHLTNEILGPKLRDIVRAGMNVPSVLQRAHRDLRRQFLPKPTDIQYTPWAINSLGKISEALHILRFTFETTMKLEEFFEAMKTVLQLIEDLGKGSSRYRQNHALNLGLRIHFTGPTKTGRLLGVGLNDPRCQTNEPIVLAHLTFSGVSNPGPSTLWTRAANHTTNVLLHSIPRCVLQWKSEWPNSELIKQRYHELLSDKVEPLKHLAAISDRDGVFLNELLMSILYPELTFYQNIYQTQRMSTLSSIALGQDFALTKV